MESHMCAGSLAGGVAAGTFADMVVSPGGALLQGSIAGILSVFGYKYVTPWLTKRFGLMDTCGIHNLHGMPGLLGGLAGIIASTIATESKYGAPLDQVFPRGSKQAGYQVAAYFITLAIAMSSAVLCAYAVKWITRRAPSEEEQYDDKDGWEVPGPMA